jgi:predicted nucleic acid-binding protein
LLYFDTSFLTPLFLEESTSPRIERFLTQIPAGELAVSQLARIEFTSLLAREVRMGGLEPAAARDADVEFESIIQESFVILMPTAEDFDLAKEFLSRHKSGLRAGDALHLAIAKNNRMRAIYSLDKTMLKAGRLLDLPTSAGIRLRA